ncbi:queuosine precursor transporter [Amaricoccus solimangrovi]|uniref:Probable queuosine precursor transporter n=1 Tax=Amaricoccus solimangrovi TaxID=2589815 RepID=A0A501WWU4_9RHOB|nr:queuosine precursor transporter [Amaricoccus solimangrovi]TPE51411.1 queuosine precursor transporter [Amaricoccus solimangrovi]
MKNSFLLGVIAMAIVVLASNILVQFLFGQWLTWGAFTYPFAFLVTDLMNRLRGPSAARRVVYAGFLTGLVCSLIGTQIEGQFGPLVSLRVAIGSLSAFLVGQLLDVAVFNRLRRGSWWRAPLVSSTLGSVADTVIFFSLAFSASLAFIAPGVDVAWANEPVPLLGQGPVLPLWVSLALADFSVKFAIAVFALAPFRMAIWNWQPRAAK